MRTTDKANIASRHASLDVRLRATKFRKSTKTMGAKEENARHWITFYRRNWDIFAMRVLQVPLKPFQRIMLYLIGVSDVFWTICSRGLSKSTICGLAAIIRCMLYPYSEVVITASTIEQANRLVCKRIEGDIIKKLSPYLLHCMEKDYIIISRPSGDSYLVRFTLNNSTIQVMVAGDSSRGERATMMIYEEARLVKKNIVDSVFEKMGHPRGAIFLQDPVYANNPRWQEEAQSVFLTSSGWEYEWFWKEYKKCFVGYFNDKRLRNNVFAGDIFLAIDNGLKTWGDFRKGKRSSEMEHRKEDLNELFRENSNGFFTNQSFAENRTIEQGFVPPSPVDIYMNNDLHNKPKADTEIRLVVVDYAFANTTSQQKNDNTFIMCMSLHWKGNRFERHVDYVAQHEASDSIGASQHARILRALYDADYFIPDSRNGGEVLFNEITTPLGDTPYGNLIDTRGLTISDETELQVVPDNKLADFKRRTVDPNAIPCVIPFVATDVTPIWVSLKRQLTANNIKFLIPTEQKQELLENTGEYFKLNAGELADVLLPYAETDEMIKEAINLTAEFRKDKIFLSEPRSGTKDRIVVLSYANFIADKIENQWCRYSVSETESIEDIQLVF